ncbi:MULTISPECIES: ATP-binding response regulator [Stenotrophomonas]|uniref:ATP-binding response regulator n=1 Tax=Stenotrophomonas TaxID=40323 RepID=UPI000A3009D5|nr:ATP-binding protein [Stenotrophomonas maltophilia]ARQ91834.1 hybrid sensor histidine kinase/response regulator [Stenotrophomonas maltophilia]
MHGPHTSSSMSSPAALLHAARLLEMHRLALLLSCFQEPRASGFRVLLQALAVLWCWLWIDGPQPVLADEAARVLPAAIVLLAVSVAWALFVNLCRARRDTWYDAAGLLLSLAMVAIQVHSAFILLMALNATLPFLVIAATVAYGRKAMAPAIAVTAVALLWAAPEGYWFSRPAYLAYALALTILLPLVVASLVAAMREIALRAIASREAQGRFVGTMSHELRTPLNAIISGIQLLEVNTASAAQRHALATVAGQAQALRHRIDDVLDVASIDGGKLKLRPHPCSLRSIIEAAQANCMPAAADKGVVLQVDAGRADVWLLADGGRIEQVVTNLLCNAIKFSPMAGEARVSVGAVRSVDDWQVRISVCDSGTGIDDAQRDTIFSPFVQVSQGEARCEQGVGLGLYIVRLISDAMGGTISVGRSDAGGASFVWCFAAAVADEADPLPSLDELFQSHAAVVRPLHCLLFEDVETNREVVQHLLQCAGHRLSFRQDGHDAQAVIKALAPDVVLLDLHMPGCSGWDVLEALVRDPGAPPVLVMSADTRVEVIDRAQALGAAGFLCKPLDIGSVLDMLRGVAER